MRYESTLVQDSTACVARRGPGVHRGLLTQQMPWTLVYLALHPFYCQVLPAVTPWQLLLLTSPLPQGARPGHRRHCSPRGQSADLHHEWFPLGQGEEDVSFSMIEVRGGGHCPHVSKTGLPLLFPGEHVTAFAAGECGSTCSVGVAVSASWELGVLGQGHMGRGRLRADRHL